MSNYFTIYKKVAVLAFAYCSSYHGYYLRDYKLGVHVYYLWPPHYYKLEVHVYCLWPITTMMYSTNNGRGESLDECLSLEAKTKFFPNILAPFIYSGNSLHLPLQLALCEGHMYCLCPLPHLLLVCTTLVFVLFVATPTSTICVYYFSVCTVCGHYHIYY